MAINVSFLVCFLPITIHATLMMIGVKPSLSTVIFALIAQELVLINSAMNVFLYAVVITGFKDAFRYIFCCKCDANIITVDRD